MLPQLKQAQWVHSSKKAELIAGEQVLLIMGFSRKKVSVHFNECSWEIHVYQHKPAVNFEIHSTNLPEQHLMLLLALGFYTIKHVAIEVMPNDFIVAAVA